MPKLDPSIDEYTLLCERCGYVIEGLATDGVCPECGKPIAESLPERRVGTPWQQSRGWKSLAITWWLTLTRPCRTLQIMRFDRDSSRWLAISACGIGLPLAPVFLLLTWVEARGLVFIGTRHGYRLHPSNAWIVCAHGCVGWVVISVSLAVGGLVFAWGVDEALSYYGYAIEGNPEAFDPTLSEWLVYSSFVIAGLGSLAGFLFFEWFAWLGLRRCKFANRARSLPESTSASEAGPAGEPGTGPELDPDHAVSAAAPNPVE